MSSKRETSVILTITRKEFHQHIISFRFIVCFILSVILISISTYYRSINFSERLREYNTAVINSQNDMEQIEALSLLQPKVHKPPVLGSVFVEGIERKLGTETTISHRYIPAESQGGKILNQFAGVFKTFDFSDVAVILLILLAFLLSYDVVSGEKERGLLSLALSNSIPRHHILLGKFSGGLLSLTFSLTAGMLVGILVMLLVPDVQVSWDFIFRIGLIYFASLVFLSLMLLLGIIVSSITHQSFLSLIFLMFVWVLFTLIIPRAANYTALQVKTITSKREVNEQISQLNTEMNRKITDYKKTIQPQRSFAAMNRAPDNGGMLTIYGNPPETVEYYRQLCAYACSLQMEYAQIFWNLERKRIDDLDKQAKLAEVLSSVSPTAIYKRVLSALAGTDRASYENFINSARNHRLQIIDYIKSQGGFSSDRFFMQYDYNPTEEELRLSREVAKLYQDYIYARQQSTSKQKLEKLMQMAQQAMNQFRQYYKDHPQEARKLDLSEMPRFQFTHLDISYDLKRSMWNLGLLIFLNIFGFLTAHVAFLKYDVR